MCLSPEEPVSWGSWICDVLVRLGSRVVCLDNYSSGTPKNIEHLKKEPHFEMIQQDVSHPFSPEGEVDLILHLASRASPLEFERYPIEILRANTFGTWVTLELARKYDSRYLFTSSSEVYGNPDQIHIPTPEDYNGNVNPIGVRSCYDEGKRVGEAFIAAYHRQYGLDARIIRVHNTYGPRMRAGDIYGRVMSRFIEQSLNGKPLTVFGDGTQTRSFTYVSDMVEGVLKMAFQPNLGGEVVNLGSDYEVKIIDLAKMIIKLTHTKSSMEFKPLPRDDPIRRCPDLTKAKKLLNWYPQTELITGIEKNISWAKGKSEEISFSAFND